MVHTQCWEDSDLSDVEDVARRNVWEHSSDSDSAGSPIAHGDVDGVSCGGYPESDDDDGDAPPVESAGQTFVSYLTVLLRSRTINAKQFCTIMYHAGHAGIDEAKPLGYNPDAKTGNFSRRRKTNMNANSDMNMFRKKMSPHTSAARKQ